MTKKNTDSHYTTLYTEAFGNTAHVPSSALKDMGGAYLHQDYLDEAKGYVASHPNVIPVVKKFWGNAYASELESNSTAAQGNDSILPGQGFVATQIVCFFDDLKTQNTGHLAPQFYNATATEIDALLKETPKDEVDDKLYEKYDAAITVTEKTLQGALKYAQSFTM